MKNLTVFSLILFSFCLTSCEKTTDDGTNPAPKPEAMLSILTTNAWKMDRITDLNGNAMNLDLLPSDSRAFFGVNIQFSEDKTVRAIDPVAREVKSGGSWSFIEDNKALYIDLNKDFKGNYPINKLERSRMSLRNTMVYKGLSFEVYLELIPAL